MYANWGHLTTLQDKSTQYNPIIYTTGTKKSKMNKCRRYTIKSVTGCYKENSLYKYCTSVEKSQLI